MLQVYRLDDMGNLDEAYAIIVPYNRIMRIPGGESYRVAVNPADTIDLCRSLLSLYRLERTLSVADKAILGNILAELKRLG